MKKGTVSSPADPPARKGETRRIFLRNYRVMADIGIHAFELNRTQPLLINVDLHLGPLVASLEDDIANTLDYDFIRDGISRLIAARRYNLQETLVHAILELCMSRSEVLLARVSSEKTDVYPDCEAVGYEATWVR
jgi:dihydroneopterin aldolase